jgi:RimJ/RimL family protein N-acetyltransferase
LLEGKNVNLRIVEKEDLPLLTEWFNNADVFGQYNPLIQFSKKEIEKEYEDRKLEQTEFIVEKKDGSKIGYVWHFSVPFPRLLEIGYFLLPKERGKGYCSEAVKVMVDYLFLSKDIVRIQAHTDVANMASQKVLEKAGFKKEGTARKAFFMRGEWRDLFLYSILREEWKEPKILTKTA